MEAEDVGKDGKRETGNGKRGRPMTAPCRFGFAVLLALARVPFPVSRALTAQDTTKGKAVYVKWCAGCHGDTGAGDGPAASHMLPRPRDFTGAIYKIRTTASGQLPTDQDVLRSIDDGLPGTAMPAWKDRLSERERRDVVAYLKTFSAFFQDTSQHIVPLTFSKELSGARSAEALRVGRQFYDSIGCWKCHGKAGRGGGPPPPTLQNHPRGPVFAADLHESRRVPGGAGAAGHYPPGPPPGAGAAPPPVSAPDEPTVPYPRATCAGG